VAQLTIRDVVHPDFHADLKARFPRILAGEDVGLFETAFVTKDGQTLWVEARVSVRFKGGLPISTRGIFRDITGRREAEAVRREYQELLEGVLEGSRLGYWEWNLETGVVTRDARWAEILGYAREEIAPTIDGWKALLHPDDRAETQRANEDFAAGRSPMFRSEYRLRARNGTYRWIQDRAGVVRRDASGRPLRVSGTQADITEQKEAQQELVEREQRFRALTDTSPTVIFVWRDQHLLFVNPAAELATGYSKDELLAIPFLDLVHPEQREMLRERAAARWRGGSAPNRYEIRLVRKDGEECWLDFAAGPFVQWENQSAVLGCGIDVTERKLMEQALAEREARLVAVLQQAVDAIVTIDQRGLIESVNPALERMFGYRPEEVLGRNVSMLMPSPDRERHEGYLASYVGGGIAKIIGIGREVSAQRKDGSLFPVDLAVSELQIGEKRLFCGFLRDLTERQHAEWEYRTILETAIDGFWLVDMEARLIEVNDSYCAMSGYSRDELLQVRIQDIEADETPEEIRAQIERVIAQGSCRFERRHRRKDGTLFDVEVSTRFLPLRGGIFVVFVKDISARRQAEREQSEASRRLERQVEERTASLARAMEEMRESRLAALDMMQDAVLARDQLDAVNTDLRREVAERQRAETEKAQIEEQLRQGQKIEAIGRLAGGVAHDFNNILGVITGFGELAREELAPDHAARASLDEVLAAAKRATSLTRQLLAFSRKQVMRPETIDVNSLVGDLERMLRPMLGEDIELRLRLGESVGTVVADPSQIQQIIMNLAINARDAMPRGGALTIETANTEFAEEYVEAHPPTVPGRFVMLAISDSGVGMDAATRERCFEPFFTTKPEGRGTGLGLSTVYGIVKQNEGYVWVYSEPGMGTTFKIYLPRVDHPSGSLRVVEPEAEVATGSETILVVEDTEGLRRMIRKMLEGAGYAVLDAADGEAALEVAAAHPGAVDLLLTDVVMPKLGGNELARRLAAQRPGLRVLFMSGYTEGAISQQGVLSEGVSLLEKPFTRDTLTRAIRRALDRPANG
jgi:PAS domain S-box-containing protein